MGNILNENIRELRIAQGISQVDLARALNVSKQCVSNWENDNVLPSIEMLVRLADHFGVSTDSLLGRSTEDAVDLRGLKPEEASHIRLIVADLRKAGK